MNGQETQQHRGSANGDFSLAFDERTRRQYFALRRAEYEATFNYKRPELELEDRFDRDGLILVCERPDAGVVAGGRINIRCPRSLAPLPMEYGEFRLHRAIHPAFADLTYAEVSRMAIAREHRREALAGLLDALHAVARAENAVAVFSICPEPQARMYRLFFQKQPPLAMRFRILEQAAAPVIDGMRMRLCVFVEPDYERLVIQ